MLAKPPTSVLRPRIMPSAIVLVAVLLAGLCTDARIVSPGLALRMDNVRLTETSITTDTLETSVHVDLLGISNPTFDSFASQLTSLLREAIGLSAQEQPSEPESDGQPPVNTGAGKDGDGHGGAGRHYDTASGKDATGTVIMLHGLGSTSQEVEPLVLLGQAAGLSNTRFLLPQADTSFVSYRQVSEPSWFDILGTSPESPENRDEILGAYQRLESLIKAEYDSGIPQGRIAIVGLSQGGAVVTTTYMRTEEKLLGAVGMATWLPLATTYPDEQSETNSDVPFLFVHGTADTAVELRWAEQSAQAMRDSGRTVTLELLEGASHTFDTQFFSAAALAIDYLKKVGLN